MPLGLEGSIADSALQAILDGGTFTGVADLYMQFHTGGPGPAGTNHVATESTRKKVTFAATATEGVWVSTNTQTWASPAADEQPTFATFWDNSGAGLGAFQFSITLDMDPLQTGVSFSFNPGDITVNVNTAG